MRAGGWMAAAVIASGCGRLGFGARSDAGGPNGDGASGGDAAPHFACTAGHDEDGDGIDDCVDVCPHIADPTQADSDGDGVGDACDPNPSDPIDHIAFFDPFTGPRAEWTATSPPTFSGDAVGFETGTGSWSMSRAYVTGEHHYETIVHADALDASPSLLMIAFVGGVAFYHCGQNELDAGQDELQTAYSDDGAVTTISSFSVDDDLTNTDVDVRIDLAAPSIVCTTIIDGDNDTIADAIPTDLPPPDQMGLYLSNMGASFSYFIDIVTTP